MTIYLLSPDPSDDQVTAIETRVQEIVPEIRKIAKVEDIAGEIRENSTRKITVVYVSPSISSAGIDNLIGISKKYHQRVFFVLVSNEISASNYKQLVQSGGADWVAANGPLQEIPEIIYKHAADPRDTGIAKATLRPAVVSFLPCMGGVGNTTIALEVALQIKRNRQTRSLRTCYVDLDFQTSHVCDFLDIEPRLQISEIFEQPDRLDDQLLELFVSHHSCGLDVFAAPRSKLDPCKIDIEALDILLEMISRKYDYIIIDLPVTWFSWTTPTIESSSVVILTGINTVPCLRQLRATLDAVGAAKASSSDVAIVINRVARGWFGKIKRRQHVQRVLAKERVFYVEEDSYAVDRVNTGTPAALGGPGGRMKGVVAVAAFLARLKQPLMTAERD